MKKQWEIEDVKSIFPEFKKSEEFIEELFNAGSIMEIEAGNNLIDTGETIRLIPFLMDGLIKIYREDLEGNEILLYYISSGESCVISITASLKDERSSIKAYVEEDSTVLAVPTDKFSYLLNKYKLLHSFTYELFNIKYNQLLNSLDSLAFTDLRSRLRKYLIKEAKLKGTSILMGLTHKKIAKDLSTSREVVSRLLSSLQKEKIITISKKNITLSDGM